MTTDNRRTLLFLIRDDQILLALKKRGFGAGKWNGVGGKLEPGESLEQATIRECQEEIGVTPHSIELVAKHHFSLATHDDGGFVVYAYLCHEWDGEPTETEEMAPQWFDISNIPYADMWQDDIYWLPAVLGGYKLDTSFTFNSNEKVIDCKIHPVTTLLT